MERSFDVLVLGGGLVGLVTAHLCAQQGFSVGLIEPREPVLHWDASRIDLRCSALSKHSQQLLVGLDIWESLSPVSPYAHMLVWEAMGFGEINFSASDVGESCLGHIVENRLLLKALWEKTTHNSFLTVMCGQKPKKIVVEQSKATVVIENEQRYSAQLIIGADGKNSWVREQAGIEAERIDYKQDALVVTAETEYTHGQTAWQRFLPEGPLAFLPLVEPNVCSVVWTSTIQRVALLKSLDKSVFQKELEHAFDYRLGRVLDISEHQSFPLERLHASRYISERIALVGDAIHVVHPLAGQGVNIGLQGVSRLVDTLNIAKKKGRDIGKQINLRSYERAHKNYVLKMMGALDFVKNVFSGSSQPLSELRSLGLDAIDRVPVVKKHMIKQAMGL